jgi:radical SAM superfamily enzyme with C-terminal helix-hairpin-helix motif
VHGLIGETKNTFKLNYDFLTGLIDEGLLVRRINIRQVMPFEGTCMGEAGDRIANKHKGIFHAYKEKIRKDIDAEMLKRVIPVGTVLTDVRMELHEAGLTFGRQIATYPILAGVPSDLPLGEFYNVKVVGHGYRSITAVPYPLDVNHASPKTLESLPGVGKKRAMTIMKQRPYSGPEEFKASMDDPGLGSTLAGYFEFK